MLIVFIVQKGTADICCSALKVLIRYSVLLLYFSSTISLWSWNNLDVCIDSESCHDRNCTYGSSILYPCHHKYYCFIYIYIIYALEAAISIL